MPSRAHKSGELDVIVSLIHISRLLCILSSHAEMSKIHSYWRERPQCLTHPSPEASSRSPGSENDISWSWSEQKRVQQLLFFYPDNEVTIITLVFFFIFSLQLCHSFYNFFTILQFRKQFHYSDKTALNIGTTLFPLHVHWFLRLQPTCTCSPCSALALVHQCLHLHLANWPCDCATALALDHQHRDLHLHLPSHLQLVQHLPSHLQLVQHLPSHLQLVQHLPSHLHLCTRT